MSAAPAGLAAQHGCYERLVTRPSSTHGGWGQAGEISAVTPHRLRPRQALTAVGVSQAMMKLKLHL